MATDIADTDSCNPISVKASGRAGELICTMPFPSQPTFWGEDNLGRYRASYFDKYGDKTWVQGDFIQMNPKTEGFLMLGRS
jgi:acetoacetyl-CoA synthetase